MVKLEIAPSLVDPSTLVCPAVSTVLPFTSNGSDVVFVVSDVAAIFPLPSVVNSPPSLLNLPGCVALPTVSTPALVRVTALDPSPETVDSTMVVPAALASLTILPALAISSFPPFYPIAQPKIATPDPPLLCSVTFVASADETVGSTVLGLAACTVKMNAEGVTPSPCATV